MDDSGPVPEAQALLEHAGFLRRLALSILHDEAHADDVVQRAMLAALRHPPRTNVRAWLATVTRNLAFSTSRSERSRSRRERAVARAERLPSVDDIVARLETQRLVVEAVLALEEPYRSTIVHRFFYEWPPSEIASRTGLPLQTVRTRLKRGLAQLRARLQRDHHDRRSLMLALVPLVDVRRPAPLAAGLAIGGGIVMKLKIAGVVALVAAAALLFGIVSREEVPTAREPDRRSATASVPTADASQPELPVDPTGDAVVCTGRVVDALGQAVGGAQVSAWASGARPHSTAEFWERIGLRRPLRPAVTVESRRDGSFEILLPKQRTVVLRARTTGAVSEPTSRIVPRRDMQGIVLRLLPAGHVRGVVVDVAGNPIVGAHVRCVDLSDAPTASDMATTTGTDGAFSIEKVRCGHTALVVEHDSYAGAFLARVAVPSADHRIRLLEGRTIHGIVRTFKGEPAPGATVMLVPVETSVPSVTARTDAEGRFVAHRVAPFPMHVFAAAGALGSAHLKPEDAGLGSRLEIRLDSVRTIRGRVWASSPGGKLGVAGVRMTVREAGFFLDTKVRVRHYYKGEQSIVSGPDGYFTVEGISPAYAFVLVDDSHPRYGTMSGSVIPAATEETASQDVQVMVFAKHKVAGVVLGPDGTRVPGARVTVLAGTRPTALSDSNGQFSFEGVVWTGVPYSVRASKHGFAEGESLKFPPDKANDIEVRLRRARVVRGTVTNASGSPLAQARVEILPARRIYTYSSADGTYEFHVAEDTEPELMATLAGYEGFVGTDTLVLKRAKPPAWLLGRVTDERGRPLPGASVMLSPWHPGENGTVRTDFNGRYQLAEVSARYYQVRVVAVGYRTTSIEAILLPAEQDFVLAPGLTISGLVVDHQGRAVRLATVMAHPLDKSPGISAAITDEKGQFTIENLTAADYRLTVTADHGRWRPTVEQESVAAGVTGVELRFPKPGTIAGHVRDAEGNPLAGLEVFATPEGEDLRGGASAWTDQEGRFRIQGLYRERYRITVNFNRRTEVQAGRRSEIRNIAPAHASRPLRNVKVGTNDLDLRRKPGLEISGTVVGIDGLPAPDAGVSFMPEDERGPRGGARTNERGQFVMRGLAPGRYRIKAWAANGTRAKLATAAGTSGVRIELKQE